MAVFLPSTRLRRLLLNHTCCLKHICPLAARSCVTVLEMLPEMVSTEELLARVALPELVHLLQMAQSVVPVLLRRKACTASTTAACKLFAAVSARVSFTGAVCALVESFVVPGEMKC